MDIDVKGLLYFKGDLEEVFSTITGFVEHRGLNELKLIKIIIIFIIFNRNKSFILIYKKSISFKTC